ncbi:hypothetical protein BDR03DRAFT_470481 [Suillus americanus]|nr:hypothetical protein BDR03DRAFT_470481 [Suillus americanus]
MASLLYYSTSLIVVGSVSHSIAILCTIARLVYRVWTRHFWWEDVWAAVALIADVICLACLWLDQMITPWILSITFTSVLWAARMSIIFSVIRITNHSGCKIHKQITYLIAVSFACMWAVLIAQKTSACKLHSCIMSPSVVSSQLIADGIADVSLVGTPLYLWTKVGLSRSRQILVLSTFGTSLSLITAITIFHSINISIGHTSTTLILAYVKAAFSLLICNILVIVILLYRTCSNETVDLDQPFTSNQVFTTVILTQIPNSMTPETSLSENVQTRATKPKDEDANVRYAEVGTSTERWLDTLEDGK